MLEIWRSLVGNCPTSLEPIEYMFCSVAIILVITLTFRFIISLIKIIFGKE